MVSRPYGTGVRDVERGCLKNLTDATSALHIVHSSVNLSSSVML